MKTLHILNELRPSGAEVMLRSASLFWSERGVNSEILCTGPQPGPYSSALAESGYRIHHIPFSKSLSFGRRVYQLLKNERYDAIHIHPERAVFWYALLARLSGNPRIVRTIHNVFPFTGLLGTRRRVQRSIMRRLLKVRMVSIGPSVHENERQTFGNRCLLIPNWFDSSRFTPPSQSERQAAREALGLPSDAIVMSTVGNCARQKNHAALVEALSGLSAPSRFLYLHAGNEESDHPERQLAAGLHLEGCIRFLGAGVNISTLLQASDIFVMPSLFEGFSIAALEALAAGLPAVVTDVPGLRDLREYCDGIVWADPSAESLRRGLETLCSLNSDRRRQIGLELSQAVHSRFAIEKGAALYLKLYEGRTDETGHHSTNCSVARADV